MFEDTQCCLSEQILELTLSMVIENIREISFFLFFLFIYI